MNILKKLSSDVVMDNRMKAFLVSFFFLEFGHAFMDLLFFSQLSRDFGIYHLTLFPFISALTASTIGYFIEPKIEKAFFKPKEGKDKEIDNEEHNHGMHKHHSDAQGVLKLIGIGFIAFIILFTLSGFYTLETGEGAILTGYLGGKSVITESGFHYRFAGITDLDRYDIRNNIFKQNINLVSTKDGKIVNAEILMPFRVDDLEKFAINSVNPEEQLTSLTQNRLIKEIQGTEVNNLQEKSALIESNIKEELSEISSSLGIQIKYVKIIISEPLDVINARSSSEKERIGAETELLKVETLKESNRIKIETIKGLSSAELKYLSELALYESLKDKDVIYVVPYGTQPIIQNGKENNNNQG